MYKIQQVPRRKISQALDHLVFGDQPDEFSYNHRRWFDDLVKGRSSKDYLLWWILLEGTPVGVGLVILSRGRVGFLFHSPHNAPGVDPAGLGMLLRAMGKKCGDIGIPLMQIMVDAGNAGHAQFLLNAGLERITELIYMECDLQNRPDCRVEAGIEISFLTGRQIRLPQLELVIARTYENSHDCPKLKDLRAVSDVIESHKSTGIFKPDWWHIICVDGKHAGCGLVNGASNSRNMAELVYMGVDWEFRGRNLGKIMLTHIADLLISNEVRNFQLAVDSQNPYAIRVYREFGFVEKYRKICLGMINRR